MKWCPEELLEAKREPLDEKEMATTPVAPSSRKRMAPSTGKVAPSSSKDRKIAAQPMPPPPPPPPPPVGESMPPPKQVPMKQGSGWMNKCVALAYLVNTGQVLQAQRLVKKYEKSPDFKNCLVQHEGLVRSEGSDPKRDYLNKGHCTWMEC